MKKSLKAFLIGAFLVLAGGITAIVSESNTPPPSGSKYFSSTYYVNEGTYPVWYGPVDTIKGAGTDTIRVHITGQLKSICFTNDHWHQAGTSSLNVAVSLYGSSNNGVSYDSIPLNTYTAACANVYSVTAGAKTRTYVPNPNFGGSPMTDYMWVATGTAASTKIWQSYITTKPN